MHEETEVGRDGVTSLAAGLVFELKCVWVEAHLLAATPHTLHLE